MDNVNGRIKCLQVIAALLLCYVALSFLFPGKSKYDMKEKMTIYGSMQCPWTTKQIDYVKSKGMEYDFVECRDEPSKCPGIKSHPTTKMSDGTMVVGFKEF